MNETLINFFEKYQDLFREGMSTGDSDDVLMELICIIDEDKVVKILEKLRENNAT